MAPWTRRPTAIPTASALAKPRHSWHSLRPVSPASLAALAVLALVSPPTLDLRARTIDPAATEAGLRSRVARLDDWQVQVTDGTTPAEVEVVLRSPDGRSQRRRVALDGTTPEDRSRELAASLALLIEQWDDPPTDPPVNGATHPPASTSTTPTSTAPDRPAQPPPAPTKPRGWLGVGPRLELGRSLLETGLDVQGGVWLLREHLQPLASLGWSVAARDGLSLNSFRLGLGLAAGAPLPTATSGRLWLGAHALAHGSITLAHDARSALTGASSTELGGLLQLRWPRWMIGLRSGVDLVLPPLRARGDHARLTRGPAQFVLGVQFALVFG